jgi:single-stranded DNA-binding protein
MDINACIFTGHINRLPEIRLKYDGMEYATFIIAVNEAFKSAKTGEFIQKTFWLRCVVFTTHIVQNVKRLNKGSKVEVHGRLSIREITDKNMLVQHETSLMVHKLVYHPRIIYDKPIEITDGNPKC